MKELVCRLAWWVLWKWWPDRVYLIREAGRFYEVSTPDVTDWARAKRGATTIIEKLDHAGRRVP